MITMHSLQRAARPGGIAFALSLALAAAPPAAAAPGYDDLLQTMSARQARLDEILLDRSRCLGERLDGLLEINTPCTAEARELALAENHDRAALHALMAADLASNPKQVGRERAARCQDRYRPGVLREVLLSDGDTTWWDGIGSHPDKTSIARVLALRYARIHRDPDAASAVVRDNVQQYEAFGVVDSTEGAGGERWFKVTEEYVPKVKPSGWSPQVLGWIPERNVIPWRRALVMRFTNPNARERSIFFRDSDSLLDLVRSDPDSRARRVERLRAAVERGTASGEGVIALEPSVGIGQEKMIMYPVLDFYRPGTEEGVRIDGKASRLLEVAARTRSGKASGGFGADDAAPIDIFFVMDTTNSMKPYLEDVLAATEAFSSGNRSEDIRFGFIGYRDKHPEFGYVVREYTSGTQPPETFARTLRGVEAQRTPPKGDDIPEAVLEGIDAVVERAQWRPGAVKIIFLVGDAPGREDALKLDEIRQKAFTRRIGLYAFHIRGSQMSSGFDPKAEKQYKELSSTYQGAYGTSAKTPHHLSIDARAADFRNKVLTRYREATGSFAQMRAYARGELSELPAGEPGSLSELIFQQAAVLLADKSLPDGEIRGWVADKVLTDPGREALAPMVLLNEHELEELASRVSELKQVGEMALRGEGGTTLDFFDLVSRNTRITIVDPTAVSFRDAFSVPLGIDRLPYDSDIMATTREEFQNMDRVQDFVARMDRKLSHYEDLRRQRGNPEVWKQLSTGARDRDRVVGVELNQLP